MPNNPPVPAPAADPPNTQWLNVSRYNTQNVIGSTSGGGGAPGGMSGSVQFNSNGTLGGDANLVWSPPNGLQALGTNYAFVAKSPNYQTTMASTSGGSLFQGHVAIGNNADVDVGMQWPGDGPGQDTYNVALLVDDFVSGNLGSLAGSGAAAQAIYTGAQNTGTAAANYNALLIKPNIVGASTGPFNYYSALWIDTAYSGSGPITSHWGIRLACGIRANCTNLTGVEIIVNNWGGSATTANAIGLNILPFNNFGTMTKACGIQVGDLSSLGSNIHSMGTGSVNIFDGKIRLGVSTNPSPQDGDLWYDGTHLNFRHGGTTTALV